MPITKQRREQAFLSFHNRKSTHRKTTLSNTALLAEMKADFLKLMKTPVLSVPK
jgi:hypothetical protein